MSSAPDCSNSDTLSPAILPYLISPNHRRLILTPLNDPNQPEHKDRGSITGSIISAPDPNVTWMMDDHCKHLYIRSDYVRIYEKLMNFLSNRRLKPKDRLALITGAPGIGKSHFLAYMMWRLFDQAPSNKIAANGIPLSLGAVERSRLPIRWVIYLSRGWYIFINFDYFFPSVNSDSYVRMVYKEDLNYTAPLFTGTRSFRQLMESPDVLLLVNYQGEDERQPVLAKYKPYTVVVSSPANKGLCGLQFRFQIVNSEWSIEEVQSFSLFSETPITEPKQIPRYFDSPETDWSSFIVEHCIWRFCRFGGLPRLVFSSLPNFRLELAESQALKFLDFETIDESLRRQEIDKIALQQFFLYKIIDEGPDNEYERFSISLRPQLLPLFEHRLARRDLKEILNRVGVIDRGYSRSAMKNHPHVYGTFKRAFVELLRNGFEFPIRFLGVGQRSAARATKGIGFLSSVVRYNQGVNKEKFFQINLPESAGGPVALPIHDFMSTHMGDEIAADVVKTPFAHVCVPQNSDFPAIDAFVRPNLLFQIDYAKSHSISADLAQILNGLNLTGATLASAPRLFTVVPAADFESFQHQPSDLKQMPDNVYRFVICMDSALAIDRCSELSLPENPLSISLPDGLPKLKDQVSLLKPILESFLPSLSDPSLPMAELRRSLPE